MNAGARIPPFEQGTEIVLLFTFHKGFIRDSRSPQSPIRKVQFP
jgi:hypothetical protein